MPLTHLSHPEDLILTGETWVVDAMFGQTSSSLKIDGCPAVVWGTHPETGKFFVGTKSVFNKKLIKICYSESDVHSIYAKQPELAAVLAACFVYLPRTEGIYQGDFIGFGGSQRYTPNTLTYDFGERVAANIIVAPHTQYHIPGPICEAEASPLQVDFDNTPHCMFVQPIVDRVPQPEELAWHVPANNFQWLTPKQVTFAKQEVNKLLKTGQEINVETLSPFLGEELATLYYLVMSLKHQVMASYIIYNSPKCFIGDEQVQGEGFVMTSAEGSFKLVDRYQFSYANFTQGKFS